MASARRSTESKQEIPESLRAAIEARKIIEDDPQALLFRLPKDKLCKGKKGSSRKTKAKTRQMAWYWARTYANPDGTRAFMSQSTVAKLLGVTREHANTIFGELRDDLGLFVYEGKSEKNTLIYTVLRPEQSEIITRIQSELSGQSELQSSHTLREDESELSPTPKENFAPDRSELCADQSELCAGQSELQSSHDRVLPFRPERATDETDARASKLACESDVSLAPSVDAKSTDISPDGSIKDGGQEMRAAAGASETDAEPDVEQLVLDLVVLSANNIAFRPIDKANLAREMAPMSCSADEVKAAFTHFWGRLDRTNRKNVEWAAKKFVEQLAQIVHGHRHPQIAEAEAAHAARVDALVGKLTATVVSDGFSFTAKHKTAFGTLLANGFGEKEFEGAWRDFKSNMDKENRKDCALAPHNFAEQVQGIMLGRRKHQEDKAREVAAHDRALERLNAERERERAEFLAEREAREAEEAELIEDTL